jgi:phenylalanyl-tRNA synthetase beta chain
MNISLNWLSEYVNVNRPISELEDVFLRIGLNVEGVQESDADIVFDLEVTSNRPDCLGHLGVARELAAALGEELKYPAIVMPSTVGKAAEMTSVEVLDPALCPRYTARVIRDVKVGPSPGWLRDHLESVGLRSVNNVVDVTNFVLMEYSQPLHSFDFDKLAEGRIVVRRAKPGEELVSIDETLCKLTEEMLVIADAEHPVAIAGIMGGLNTEVTDATVNLLIESAQFDPLNIRRTSRTLGLMSDSNYRFERGVDPVRVEEASLRACAMICEIAGGELVEGVVDVWATPYEAPRVTLRPARTNALLGIDIPADRQKEILQRLGLSVQSDADGRLACEIPSHRADLRREADLIEEVARIVGFDAIPVAAKVTHPVISQGHPERLRRETLRQLNAAGYNEAITFSFLDAEEAVRFGWDQPVCVDALVRKTNNALRPTIEPSLLRACKRNQDAGNAEVRLFELAAVFPPNTAGDLPEEYTQLALASTEGLRDLRGAVETLVERLCPEATLTVEPADQTGYAPGVAGEIRLNDVSVGVIGRIAPAVLDHYGLEKPIAAARLRFDALAELANLTRTATPLPKFPAVQRDLSLIVGDEITWGQIRDAIGAVPQDLRVGLDYVTTYRGKPIPAGKKSVTVALEYRSEEGTLTGEQVDRQVDDVMSHLGEALSAELRT